MLENLTLNFEKNFAKKFSKEFFAFLAFKIDLVSNYRVNEKKKYHTCLNQKSRNKIAQSVIYDFNISIGSWPDHVKKN